MIGPAVDDSRPRFPRIEVQAKDKINTTTNTNTNTNANTNTPSMHAGTQGGGHPLEAPPYTYLHHRQIPG